MINERAANYSFKQVRFDKRLEGAEEISHAGVCAMAFKAKGTAETKAQGCNASGVARAEREKG